MYQVLLRKIFLNLEIRRMYSMFLGCLVEGIVTGTPQGYSNSCVLPAIYYLIRTLSWEVSCWLIDFCPVERYPQRLWFYCPVDH